VERIYVGFGSNVDRRDNVAGGLGALAERFGALTVSTIYACPAVGFDGDDFYNGVVAFDSDEPVAAVHAALRRIEARFGRDRRQPRYAARSLDLDLLLFGDRIVRQDGLVLPRPEIERMAFVLAPLAELALDRLHPVRREPFTQLWANFSARAADRLSPVDRRGLVDTAVLA
jgi:2-amino-4-hydroxy-6-hydroxymethyldihydropteridine diphosphokinase